MELAPDVESAGQECVNVRLTEKADVARERMFENSKREAGPRRVVNPPAVSQGMKHTGGEGITGTDAIDDA